MMEDHPLLTSNGGGASMMDQARTHNFPGALLGLQGKICHSFNDALLVWGFGVYIVSYIEYQITPARWLIHRETKFISPTKRIYQGDKLKKKSQSAKVKYIFF